MFPVQSCLKSLYTGFLGGEIPEVSRSPNNPASSSRDRGRKHLAKLAVNLAAKHLVTAMLKVQGTPGVSPQ